MASHHVINGRWKAIDAPIDPDAVKFGIEQAPVLGECDGCMFNGQLSPVCRRASAIATAAGGFDCDQQLPNGLGVIYVPIVADQRQQDLVDGQEVIE